MKRFPSVKKKSEFQKIYSQGTSYANRLLVMYVLKDQTEGRRIGISVSKRVGNSVVRHHIVRIVREVFRLNEDKLETGLDIVIVARVAAKESDFKHLESAFMHLCELHHIKRSKESK